MIVVRWLVRTVVALVLGCLLAVVVTGSRVWWVGRQDDRPHSDTIIVLGASQYDGRPSEVLKERLDHARTLYDEHVAAHVLTIGGKQPGDRFTEGQAGAAYLAKTGVPSGALLAVGVGNDTLESLRAAKAVLDQHGWRSAVLVTDPWHCLRSRTMADDLGIAAQTSPVHSGPAVQGRGTELRYIARETAAYLDYEITGGSSEKGPGAV